MTLVKWSPRTRQIGTMHETLDDLVREVFSDFPSPWFRANTVGGEWLPPMDVVEEEGRFVVSLDLPGMRREDVTVSVENGTLTLKGERQHQSETKDGYRRFERSYGTFTRTIGLPRTIDSKRIEAAYKDGVLTVTLPKSEEARPKAIEVKVN
jgi:HSP20 family protein